MKYRDNKKSFNATTQNATRDEGDTSASNLSSGDMAMMECSKCDYQGKPKVEDGKKICPDCGAEMRMPDGTKTFVLTEHDPMHEHSHADGTTHQHPHDHVEGTQHDHFNAHTHNHSDATKTISQREDVSKADKERAKSEYGDVKFADEKNKKYPLEGKDAAETETRIRSAWNYINKEKDAAKYSADEVKQIKDRIIAAWKAKIDKAGPPSAEENKKTFEPSGFVAFGDSLKTLGEAKDGLVPVGGYLIRYGDENHPDLTKEDFFAVDTDYGSAKTSETWFHHCLPVEYQDAQGNIKAARITKRFAPGELTKDEVGVFFKSVLNERDEYEKYVLSMVRDNKLGLSSGAPTHLIERKTMPNGTTKITRWILGTDASYDHTPAEWRGNIVSVQNVKTFRVDALPKDETQQGMRAESQGEPGQNIKTQVITSEDAMDEKEKQALLARIASLEQENLTVEQRKAIKTIAEQFGVLQTEHAAMKKALEGEKPNSGGILVDQGQKYPYKSFVKDKQGRIIDARGYGEFLTDEMERARSGHMSDRLIKVQDLGVKSMKAVLGLNVRVPSEGGVYVQPDHSAELVRNMFEQGDILSRINKTPLGPGADGVTLNGIDETSRATSLWGGVVVYHLAEGDAATQSKPKFREIKLETKGYGALYYATDKVLRTAPALGMDVAGGFRGAMSYFVEEDIINGDGTGKCLGLMDTSLTTSPGSTIAVSRTTASHIQYADIVNMWARLFPEVKKDAIWLVNSDTLPDLNSMFLPAGIAGIPAPFLTTGADGQQLMMGRPIVESEHCQSLGTSGDIILWSPSTYRFCDMGDVEEATSIHVEFLTAQTVFRYLYYADGQPQLKSRLTPKHGSTTRSTQIVLS